jgi:hypothetical protein
VKLILRGSTIPVGNIVDSTIFPLFSLKKLWQVNCKLCVTQSGLTSQTGQDLINLMKRLNQERGLTFVFTTYDPQVMEAAQCVIRLVDGQLIEDTKR